MKLIFLDIDGVFNSDSWYKRREELGLNLEDRVQCDFDPNCVVRFNRIIEQTEAKVIVSSCWRNGSLQYLKDLFKEIGLNGEVIGETPRLSWECKYPGVTIPRGVEIKAVLNKMNYPVFEWSTVTTEVENYVIIDDDSDMLLEQKDHFVQTSWKYGLVDEDVQKVISILDKWTFKGWL